MTYVLSCGHTYVTEVSYCLGRIVGCIYCGPGAHVHRVQPDPK